MSSYYKRKEKGICTDCGKQKAIVGKIRCDECSKKQVEENRLNHAFYIKIGICPFCRKEKLFGSEKSCPECNAKRVNANDVYRNRNRERYNKMCSEYRKKYKAEREAKGLCNRCGKRAAETGRKTCIVCREKQREQQRLDRDRKGVKVDRNERVANGLCYFCAEPIDRDGKSCSKCAAIMTANLPEKRGGGKHIWRMYDQALYKKGK